MAEPVYDDQKPDTEKKQGLTPEEIRAQEDEVSKSYGNDGHYLRDKWGDKQRDLREASQGQDAKEAEDLRNNIRDQYSALRKQDEDDGKLPKDGEGGFYRDEGKGGFIARARNSSRRQKTIMAAAGGGVIGLVVALSGIMGFLSTFRLDHMISTVDLVSMAKVNATFSRRSDRFLRAYVQTRLAEWNGTAELRDDGSVDFRSSGVDTDRPFTDWYRTLRSNNFENKVFNQQGIYFTANTDGNGRRVSYAVIRGTPGEAVGRGASITDPNFSSQIDNATREVFNDDRSMRREIKKVVNDNTRSFQVLKRRHLRKDIQNKIGVRSWRFFETSRDKFDMKKSDFKLKMLTAILPEDTKSGKFLACLFGMGPCTNTTDSNAAENRSGGLAEGDGLDSACVADSTNCQERNSRNTDGEVVVDGDGNTTVAGDADTPSDATSIVEEAAQEAAEELGDEATEEAAEGALSRFRSKFVVKILNKFNVIAGAVDILDTLDTFYRVHKNLLGGKLAAMVVMARGVQAVNAYTQYGIMSDQVKAGEFSPQELGYVMQGLNGMENSEAYDYFFKGSGASTASAMADKETFCSDEYERQPNDYYWMCDDVKIGGASGASKIESVYKNNPAFAVPRTIFEAYGSARNSIFGRIVGGIFSAVGDVLNGIIERIVTPILELTGLDKQMEKLMAWLSNKLMVALGAGPILTGDFEKDPAGLTMNMIGQGAAQSAEDNLRGSGASLAPKGSVSYNYLQKITADYLEDRQANQSVYERYFALDNPTSVASTSLFSFINTPFSYRLANFGQTILNSFGSIFSIISGRTYAASDSFGAAALADIETYAIPPQCFENDPLTATPEDMTNADDEGFVPVEEIDWDLLRDSEAFWDRVYQDVDLDDQEKIKEIYNCATLDQRVMGSIGYTSGYRDDGGLEDGNGTNNQTSASGPVTIVGDKAFPLAVNKSDIGGDIFQNGNTNTAGHPYTAYDLIAPQGTGVVAMASGTIVRISDDCIGTSAAVTLNIPSQGISIWYGHMDPSTIAVSEGQSVSAGDTLGTVGAQDCKSGAEHLHIDASVNVAGDVYRPGCARESNGGCPTRNKIRFRSIGAELYNLYQALPD